MIKCNCNSLISWSCYATVASLRHVKRTLPRSTFRRRWIMKYDGITANHCLISDWSCIGKRWYWDVTLLLRYGTYVYLHVILFDPESRTPPRSIHHASPHGRSAIVTWTYSISKKQIDVRVELDAYECDHIGMEAEVCNFNFELMDESFDATSRPGRSDRGWCSIWS